MVVDKIHPVIEKRVVTTRISFAVRRHGQLRCIRRFIITTKDELRIYKYIKVDPVKVNFLQ